MLCSVKSTSDIIYNYACQEILGKPTLPEPFRQNLQQPHCNVHWPKLPKIQVLITWELHGHKSHFLQCYPARGLDLPTRYEDINHYMMFITSLLRSWYIVMDDSSRVIPEAACNQEPQKKAKRVLQELCWSMIKLNNWGKKPSDRLC